MIEFVGPRDDAGGGFGERFGGALGERGRATGLGRAADQFAIAVHVESPWTT